jgi:hypothetical protein
LALVLMCFSPGKVFAERGFYAWRVMLNNQLHIDG